MSFAAPANRQDLDWQGDPRSASYSRRRPDLDVVDLFRSLDGYGSQCF
jgi:hypothetical protein